LNAIIISLSTLNQQCYKIPLFTESVPAGFPSPAQDYVEKSLDLNELCITHPAATYFVRVSGDSMIGEGIFDGDILVVDRALEAKHGYIVVAAVDGELTVKKLCTHPRPALIPANPAYKPIVFEDGQHLELFGVATSIIRNLLK